MHIDIKDWRNFLTISTAINMNNKEPSPKMPRLAISSRN